MELRNPFRSDTNESMASMGRTDSFDSFADTGVPVHRTVRAFRPAHIIADASHAPQKAAIFTTEVAGREPQVSPLTVNATSDPFADSPAASQSTLPVISTVGSPIPREETTVRSYTQGLVYVDLRSLVTAACISPMVSPQVTKTNVPGLPSS